MAFLQIKKSVHLDRTFSCQLKVNPIEISGKMNNFEKLDYEIPVTNIGENYSCEKWGENDPITFKQGDSLNLKCSSSLYSKLVDFSKGELVDVTMKSHDKGVKWIVEMSSKEWDRPVDDGGALSQPYGYDSVKIRDTDRSLEIKWGMAFNNATRLVESLEIKPTEDATDIHTNILAQKLLHIQTIMPEMFEIACSMKPLTKPEIPMVVSNKKINDDELPF